jgi:hypothetical protein
MGTARISIRLWQSGASAQMCPAQLFCPSLADATKRAHFLNLAREKYV